MHAFDDDDTYCARETLARYCVDPFMRVVRRWYVRARRVVVPRGHTTQPEPAAWPGTPLRSMHRAACWVASISSH
jgi:hypothetical protein